MNHTGRTYWFWILLLSLGTIGAQEAGSAELFTEEYTDRFQELFFEAIKQKGIENYDRAEALFLEAKQLDPISPVIDHELAKVLLQEKEYARAERYALDAVRARPEEYWFVQTLMTILDKQSKFPEAYPSELPLDLPEFRINLASWYLGQKEWDRAEDQLAPLPATSQVRLMKAQIAHARLNQLNARVSAVEKETPVVEEGSAAAYEQELRNLLGEEKWVAAEASSREALESYPLQPFFYYANGISQLRQGRIPEAIGVLEEGEGVLLGNSEIAQLLYTALAEAHSRAGNTEKAKKYQNKLKDGS